MGIFDKISHNMTKVLLLKRFVFDKMERESGEPDCFNALKFAWVRIPLGYEKEKVWQEK